MLIGREKEIKALNDALESNNSELIVVYGRRRVGKTFLIRNVYKDHIIFEATGYYKGMKKDQLRNFYLQIKRCGKINKASKEPGDWIEAFELLKEYLDKLRGARKKVLFIDEFPWFATHKSNFLMVFEHFWNTYCTKRNDLVVVICGSSASYIVQKIIKNKGGLHNRLSKKINLMPFNLHETEKFLQSRKINLLQYDILQLYMVLGGIPHYLEKVKKGKSIHQIIDDLCFTKDGFLAHEFDEVFASLFDNSDIHELIIRNLSQCKKGIDRSELLNKCKTQSNGKFSKALNDLIESGFIHRYSTYRRKNQMSLYRISDEYTLFFLKFIEPGKNSGSGTWMKMFPKQTYKVWCGLAFESLCLKHIYQIKKELGIHKIYSVSTAWYNNQAQIDLLIDRDDNRIDLCEIKFYASEFSIDKKYSDDLKKKKSEFINDSKTKKGVFITMISTFGTVKNEHFFHLVENDLKSDCLFQPE